jgi:hypothetical protein
MELSDDVIDYIDEIIQKKLNEMPIQSVQQQMNVPELLDRLDINFRRSPSSDYTELRIYDRATGYTRTFPIAGNFIF